MHDVVVYSRKECHLCDIVKETLTQFQGDADFQWRDVDIDIDPQLRQKYNDDVPLVFIDGRKAFKYRMDGHQFLRALLGKSKARALSEVRMARRASAKLLPEARNAEGLRDRNLAPEGYTLISQARS